MVARCAAAMALLAISALGALPAQAIMREVDPGKVPKLGNNDGLLLVSVDSDVTLQFVRIFREGLNFDIRTLRAVQVGRNSHLYVVPAGRYRWATLGYIGEYRLSKDPEFGFDVTPGVLNYPGDQVFRSTSWSTAIVHVCNRSLLGMDWLRKTHPALSDTHAFTFTGRYPDPFPALYRETIAGHPLPEDKTLPVPPSGTMPLPLEEFWRPCRLQMITLKGEGHSIDDDANRTLACEGIAGFLRENLGGLLKPK